MITPVNDMKRFFFVDDSPRLTTNISFIRTAKPFFERIHSEQELEPLTLHSQKFTLGQQFSGLSLTPLKLKYRFQHPLKTSPHKKFVAAF